MSIFVFIDHSWTHMYILGDSEGESNPNKYVLDGAVGESNPSKVCSCCGLTMWVILNFEVGIKPKKVRTTYAPLRG